MPVYRYRSSSVTAAALAKVVPGTKVVGSTGPGLYVDVTADAGSKTDLDDYMAFIGWAYVSTDPATTVFNDFATWAAETTPGLPSTNNLRLYVNNCCGKPVLAALCPTGEQTSLQASFYSCGITFITPTSGSNVHVVGTSTSISGNASTPSLANTNLFTSLNRTRFYTSTSAHSQSGIRTSDQVAWRGNAAGLGGFYYGCLFGWSTQITGQRSFVGLWDNTSSPGDIDYSTMIDMVGVGYDAGDTYLQIMHNDNNGNASKISLGANFPKNTTSVYNFRLFSAPNGSTIGYYIKDLVTGNSATGVINSDLPRNTVFLGMYAYVNNNATAEQAQLEVMRQYVEADL